MKSEKQLHKKDANVRTIQRKAPEQLNDKRKREYMVRKRKVKCMTEENERRVNGDSGRNMIRIHEENKELHSNEVHKEKETGWKNRWD